MNFLKFLKLFAIFFLSIAAKADLAKSKSFFDIIVDFLTDLSIFKNYIKSNNDFPNTYNLHNYSLIATKICHHANVSIKDINYIFKALKKVHDYFLNES